jgi:hypothetical protein
MVRQTVAHHVQVSVIPSWLGTTQIRQVRFHGPDRIAFVDVGTPQRRGDEHDIDQLGTPAATIRGTICQPPGPH